MVSDGSLSGIVPRSTDPVDFVTHQNRPITRIYVTIFEPGAAVCSVVLTDDGTKAMGKKFETEVHLSREMGLMDATLIGVGAMIGAGIFVLIGIAAGVAGPALIIAFSLNGLVALLTAMSYAELGSCYHDAGGGYLWVKEGLPKWNGFLSGWMSWFAHAVACSVYALGFGAYFAHIIAEFGVSVPHLGFLGPEKILAVAIALLFAYINFRGASETGKIGNTITMAKIAILGVFVAFGLEFLSHRTNPMAAFSPFAPNGFGGIVKAMGLTFIAFQGFEVISQSSEEIRDPKRNIPRAVFFSLAIVVPIYILVAIAALGSVESGSMKPWDFLARQKEIALVQVSKQFFTGGGIMLLAGGLISTMSALNATIYSSSRVAFAMGRDRNFPGLFSKVHRKNVTPHWAISSSLIIILFMVVTLHIEDVASAADIMFLLLFLQVNLALISLRKKRPDLDRGFTVPLYPWLSILAILLLLAIAVSMLGYSLVAWAVTAIWICLGLCVYKFYAAKREIEHVRKIAALGSLERKEYRILTCLSSERYFAGLTRIALAVARKHRGAVVFLHVIEARKEERLGRARYEQEEVVRLLEKAEFLATEAGVRARSLVKVSHSISQSIVDTAREEGCNFIVVGRQKRPDFLDRVFSSVIDTVLQKAPVEVAVLHGELGSERVRKILLPFGTSIHTLLAAEITPVLAELFGALLRIVVVIPRGTSNEERDRAIEGIRSVVPRGIGISIEPIVSRDILGTITREAKDVDLMVMGGRTGDFLELLLSNSLSQELTERVTCPVLWLKEYEEPRSFWKILLRPYENKGDTNGG